MGQFHRFHHSMFCKPSQLHIKGPPVPLRQLNSLSQNHKKETVQRMQCPLKSACLNHRFRFIIFIALLSKNDISGQSSTCRKENKSELARRMQCMLSSNFALGGQKPFRRTRRSRRRTLVCKFFTHSEGMQCAKRS